MKEEEFQKILKCLENCDFTDLFTWECDSDTEDLFYTDVVKPFEKEFERQVSFKTGATKGVLLCEDWDFVIKIPFLGFRDWVGGSDDENICMFNGGGGKHHWDYCAIEAEIYKDAKEEGIEDFFAETRLIGYVHDHPIYAQKYAEEYNSITEDYSRVKIDQYEEENGTIYLDISNYWLEDALWLFPIQKMKKFIHLCQDKYSISDLVPRNIGIIDDKPVLVDYSSFEG